MIKKFICIECPKGCEVIVTTNDHSEIMTLAGNNCEKGEVYVRAEIENPTRVLTSSVLAKGLSLKMIPVKTSKPIPKSRIFDAMNEIKRIRVTTPIRCGDVVCRDFLGLGVNLVVTRGCPRND
ncbi:MAG: DUF1667 domain-containing protein [Candidatus Omnitrophica bacterium]|nr:DUF1667 domain-containing protein [Candidatus Omnitrophota bacterium]